MRDQTGADRRAAMRAWLVRRVEEARAEQARLESALQDLDAGQPLQHLRRDLRRDDDDDDDRRRGRFRRGERGHADTSIEERVRLVARFAREHFPEFAEQLESEQQRNPEAARRIAARFWPRIAELLELEDSQPELFAVEVEKLRSGQQLMTTVHRARRAKPLDDAARQRITRRLRKLAEQHFELRLEATRLRLESLRQSVRETERELEQRRAEGARSVEQQVQRLLRWIDREDRDDLDRDGG